MTFKIDIRKIFNNIEWTFLIKVLHVFDFNNKFCHWINTILKSVDFFISINGKYIGFFSCLMSVRQENLLSPHLLCIAKNILNKTIFKLVDECSLYLINNPKCIVFLSIFCISMTWWFFAKPLFLINHTSKTSLLDLPISLVKISS